MSKPIESAIRNVNALIILSEFGSFLTNANKATPKLKMINKRIVTIAILNTIIYSRLVLEVYQIKLENN